MTYQVFARKWRPENFTEVIGQKYIIKALSNSIKLKKIHQAWILCGTRGIGKTTIARILAKCLNCQKKISINPCKKCSSCTEIKKNYSPDLIEIDAASKTKVEDIKELLENSKYSPIKERFKIFLIDEVHMLSRYSFNALLKTLEEPPKHVKFILATTNIEKIPKTIVSRCILLHLKKIKSKKIKNQLKKILNSEKIFFEKNTLKLIASSADGSMRDALSLLEQAIAIGNGKIIEKKVQKMLGKYKYENFINLISAILKKDIKKIFFLQEKILSLDIEPDQILIELLKLLYYIYILKLCSVHWKSEKYNKNHIKILKKISKRKNIKEIQKCYSILLNGRKDLSYAPSKKIGMELTLLQTIEI
ncbi:DNA polymerase III subunit gamma/tau [Buchnera aphidicola]|uniref:DNA polymerase III subunit gamma/tau n=1 Tax=Buchnera aphidicola TaxID=9 RepID=UPI002093E234|nr:DNA polymerase III subunit gamma/tau [Buchnera aphidicola]USS94050.1 DNA polymerase III subunit gamma/tau [Buchnera aphidicola (Sipha maydis)]WII23595.1 DNA polymerase III subunit gamma/tau [Buchnera aphidicola (Sipha maydis)]